MPNPEDPIRSLRIATPCQASWEGMAGDERVRHCTLCSLNVYNIRELTGSEVRELLVRTEGRVCMRLHRRADGTVITRDCPAGLRALGRRVSRVAAAVMASLVGFSAFASSGKACDKPGAGKHGSKVKLETNRAEGPQAAVLTGLVKLEGDPVPGARVLLWDEALQYELLTTTDVNGSFRFASLFDGMYKLEVTMEGVRPATVEHLRLEANEVTRAEVAMRFDRTAESITVGAMAPDPLEEFTISTTFSQALVNKLPL